VGNIQKLQAELIKARGVHQSNNFKPQDLVWLLLVKHSSEISLKQFISQVKHAPILQAEPTLDTVLLVISTMHVDLQTPSKASQSYIHLFSKHCMHMYMHACMHMLNQAANKT
jgi:hypothetical protein